MKKILSTLLAIILVMGLCVPMAISAGAEETASDVWDGTANIKWFIDAGGKDGDNYEIKTAEDFAGLAYLVNASVSDAILKGIYYDADYNVKGYERGPSTYINDFYQSKVCTSTTGLTRIDGYDFNSKIVLLCADMILNEGNAAEWENTAPANVWQPIGGGVSNSADRWFGFNGMFDGQGHTVSGLYTSITTADPATSKIACVGLFGIVSQNQDYPCVENLTVENFFVRGEYLVGGLVGRFNRAGSLANCYVKNGYVVATKEQAGALVGGVYKGGNTIENCGVDNVTVKSVDYAGGMIGLINGQTVDIKDSYTKATVECTADAGLIVGRSSGGTINLENVYSVVKATATGETAKGGVIYAGTGNGGAPSMKIENYYYVKDMTAPAITGEGTEGATEVTLANITGDAAKTTLVGFDFDTVWNTVENGTPIIDIREASDDVEDEGEDEGENENGNENGNENNDTTVDETQPSDTSSATDKTTDSEKVENGGCASSISIASVAVVALASGAALVIKKKED